MARTIALDADGNPFLVAELARHSQSGGPGGASLEDVVRVRLAGLPEDARRIFDVVVVAGRPLPRRIAVRAAGVAADDERLLVLLRGAKLVGAFGPPTYILEPSHDRIRETALALIPPDALRRLHLRLFDALAEDPGAEPDALAVHLDGAGESSRAVPYYVAAAERAANALALDRAMALYARVWDLTRDALPLATLLAICDLARVVGWSFAEEVMRHAVARAEREGQPRHVATALFHLGSEMFQKGRYPESRDCLQRGLTLVDEDREPVLAARLRGQLGLLLGHRLGDPAHGLIHAERAVQLLDGASDRKELALGLSRLAAIYLRAGRWQDQLRCNRRHLEIAEEIGSVLGQVVARINLGANLHGLGELDEAIDHTQAAIELAARAHATVNQAVGHNNLAQMLLDAGDLAASERALAEAHRLSSLCGGLHFDVEMAITRARLAARRKDLETAERLAEEAVSTAGATGSPADQGWALRVLAAVLSFGGRHGQALRELERAAAVLETSDVGELARTRAERVRVLARGGWHDLAQGERAAARQALEEIGAGLDLARLDDLAWI